VESTKSRVVAVVADLFFRSKIQQTAEALGVPLVFASTAAALEQEIARGRAGLFIVDLGIRGMAPEEAIAAGRAGGAARTLAFVSHVDEAMAKRALEAGCDEVLAKSAFSRDLPSILSRAAAG
jgi:DNA-binding NarL/FixJ family response regulator